VGESSNKEQKKRSRNREKKKLIISNLSPTLETHNHSPIDLFKEEQARLLLLQKFGCSSTYPSYYHTALHPDLSCYDEAWIILNDKVKSISLNSQ
jgi:hypothetical protein